MIIGITGTIGAGKGTVVDYLTKNKGFRHISARSIWTIELKERNLPVDRDTMTNLANQLRAEHGPDYFVRRALQEVDGLEDVVIESVRTVAELELLQQEGAVMLAVDAEQKTRYERIHTRASDLDNVSFDQFKRQEATEMENVDPNKQNIKKVMELSDFTLENNGTLEELQQQIEAVLEQIAM